MKIERTDPLHPPRRGVNPTGTEPAGARFEEVLRNAVAAAPGVEKPGGVRDIPPAGTGTAFRVTGDREGVLSRAEELIGLLEALQGGIEGAGMTTKDACAAVRAIEDRAEELAPLVERLPEGGPFRDFMNRVVVTASVAAIKFRRGDYLL